MKNITYNNLHFTFVTTAVATSFWRTVVCWADYQVMLMYCVNSRK